MHILPQLEKKLVLPKQFNSIFLDGKFLLFKKTIEVKNVGKKKNTKRNTFKK